MKQETVRAVIELTNEAAELVIENLRLKDELMDYRMTLTEVKGAMIAQLPEYWKKGGPLWARVTGHLDKEP